MASPKECWYEDRLIFPSEARSLEPVEVGTFTCPECDAPLRVSIGKKILGPSGRRMVDHFEHWDHNPNCSLSAVARGQPRTAAAKQRADAVYAATEGRKGEVTVTANSRNRRLVKKKLTDGMQKCEACNFRLAFENKFVVECHHMNPLKNGDRTTMLEDLQLLCPTCHSIAHLQDPPMGLKRIREVLALATRA